MLRPIMFVIVIMFAFALVAAVAEKPAVAPEMVDNPAYQSWAKFAPGTSVRYTTTYLPKSTTEGSAAESSTTYTLKAVTEEKVELTVSTVVTLVSGKSITRTPGALEYPAKIEKPAETPKPTDEGEETITVADQDIDTTWTKTVTTDGTTTVTTTVWTSDSIPGGAVKSVIERKTDKTTTTETKILVEYKVVEPEVTDDVPFDDFEMIDETETIEI